jgi:hypothetical protein
MSWQNGNYNATHMTTKSGLLVSKMVDQLSYIKCKGLIIKSDTATKWSQNSNLTGPVTAIKKGKS